MVDKSSMKKFELADSRARQCGKPEQTAEHIINGCPIYRPPSEVGPETRAWLQDTDYIKMTLERRRYPSCHLAKEIKLKNI